MDNKLKIATMASLMFLASASALAKDEVNPLKPLLGERDTTIVLGDAPKSSSSGLADILENDVDNIIFDSDLPQYLLEHRRRHEEELAGPRCSDNVRPGTVIYTNPPIYNCNDLAEQDEQLRNTIREMVIEILEELRDNGNYREQLDILNGILKQGGKVTN